MALSNKYKPPPLKAMENHHVYAIFNNEDSNSVIPVIETLISHGYKCCSRSLDMLPGCRIIKFILENIDRAQHIVFFITKHFNEIDCGQYEQDQAIWKSTLKRYHHCITVVRFSGADMPKELRTFFCVDFSKPQAKKKLIKRLSDYNKYHKSIAVGRHTYYDRKYAAQLGRRTPYLTVPVAKRLRTKFNDKQIQMNVNQIRLLVEHPDLPVWCSGCRENFHLQEYISHVPVCYQFKIQCPNLECSKWLKRKDLKKHRQKCKFELVECPNFRCDIRVSRQKLLGHKKKCNQEVISCAGCGEKGKRIDIQKHQKKCLFKSSEHSATKNSIIGVVLSRIVKMYKENKKAFLTYLKTSKTVSLKKQLVMCRNPDCNELLPASAVSHHIKQCRHRVVKCPYKGCPNELLHMWELRAHKNICFYATLRCKCGTVLQRKDKIKHMDVCKNKFQNCQDFKEEILSIQMVSRLKSKWPLKITYCQQCGVKSTVKDLYKHIVDKHVMRKNSSIKPQQRPVNKVDTTVSGTPAIDLEIKDDSVSSKANFDDTFWDGFSNDPLEPAGSRFNRKKKTKTSPESSETENTQRCYPESVSQTKRKSLVPCSTSRFISTLSSIPCSTSSSNTMFQMKDEQEYGSVFTDQNFVCGQVQSQRERHSVLSSGSTYGGEYLPSKGTGGQLQAWCKEEKERAEMICKDFKSKNGDFKNRSSSLELMTEDEYQNFCKAFARTKVAGSTGDYKSTVEVLPLSSTLVRTKDIYPKKEMLEWSKQNPAENTSIDAKITTNSLDTSLPKLKDKDGQKPSSLYPEEKSHKKQTSQSYHQPNETESHMDIGQFSEKIAGKTKSFSLLSVGSAGLKSYDQSHCSTRTLSATPSSTSSSRPTLDKRGEHGSDLTQQNVGGQVETQKERHLSTGETCDIGCLPYETSKKELHASKDCELKNSVDKQDMSASSEPMTDNEYYTFRKAVASPKVVVGSKTGDYKNTFEVSPLLGTSVGTKDIYPNKEMIECGEQNAAKNIDDNNSRNKDTQKTSNFSLEKKSHENASSKPYHEHVEKDIRWVTEKIPGRTKPSATHFERGQHAVDSEQSKRFHSSRSEEYVDFAIFKPSKSSTRKAISRSQSAVESDSVMERRFKLDEVADLFIRSCEVQSPSSCGTKPENPTAVKKPRTQSESDILTLDVDGRKFVVRSELFDDEPVDVIDNVFSHMADDEHTEELNNEHTKMSYSTSNETQEEKSENESQEHERRKRYSSSSESIEPQSPETKFAFLKKLEEHLKKKTQKMKATNQKT